MESSPAGGGEMRTRTRITSRMVNTTIKSIVKKMVDKRSIRVELDDKAEERFEAIKDFHGLKSDSEAVRFCISTTSTCIRMQMYQSLHVVHKYCHFYGWCHPGISARVWRVPFMDHGAEIYRFSPTRSLTLPRDDLTPWFK